MSTHGFLQEVRHGSERFFPGARVIVLQELPFYLKARILITEEEFIEIRINTRSNRRSYAFIKKERRIAGFDNLGGWHYHPRANPEDHISISSPSFKKVFTYFKKCL